MAEMTLEEAFEAATVDVPAGMVDDIFVIDAPNRKIIVPDSETAFGVETDRNVERKYFRCPRIVGDNIDLYTHKIYVVYVFAKDARGTFQPEIVNGTYWCDDVAVDGDCITFSWKLSDNALTRSGIIAFKILAATTENGLEKTRWNTTPAYGTILMTVPDGDDIAERYPDIVTQLLKRMDAVEAIATEEAMQGYVNEYLREHPVVAGATEEQAAQIDQNTQGISELKGDLNNYAKSAFRYIPTTENNKFCRWDTGKILPLDGKSVSDRIPVTEFENVEIYSNNDIFAVCFFNNETFISGSNTLTKSFSIPANCNNVIISFNGLDTNIVLVHTDKIDDYIVNTQVLPTYEFSVKTIGKFMRWDNGKIFDTTDYMMSQPFIVESGKEYYVTGAITVAACFLNGNTFVRGIALNGVDHFTIPEGCNRCVVDFNIITDLPTIMVRDPLLRNTSPCYGKVLGCLGDSITQGVGNNNHSWVDVMKGMCGFKSVYNYGVSGNTIEQMHDRIDDMESALDYITLLGGTNNALWSNSQSIADFKASFDSLVSSIIEKYPTSKVLGIIPPKYNYSSGDVTRNWNVPTSPNNLKLIDFVNAEIEIYSKYSVPIVNLFTCCNIQPDINAQKIGLMPDGVHPNQKGYFDFIAPKIAEALKSI